MTRNSSLAASTSSRDVFLLGAGFSRAIHSGFPVLSDLNARLRNEPAFEKTAQIHPSDFELWLSFLSQSPPWIEEHEARSHEGAFLAASRRIQEEIDEATKLALKAGVPSWFRDFIDYVDWRRATVITFNYDTLPERQAAAIGIHSSNLYPRSFAVAGSRTNAVNAAEVDPSFRLLKLHGSTHWFFSGRPTFWGETIYYLPFSPFESIEQRHRAAVSDKVPLIVPPVSTKAPFFFNETIRDLWRQAATAIANADRLFIFGYSFPKTDLLLHHLFATHFDAKRTAVVIADINSEVVDRFTSITGSKPESVLPPHQTDPIAHVVSCILPPNGVPPRAVRDSAGNPVGLSDEQEEA